MKDIDISISGTVGGRRTYGLSTFDRLAKWLRPPTREQAQKSLTKIAQDFGEGQVELFDTEGHSGAGPVWKKLSKSRKKQKGGSRLLVDSGRLRRSFTQASEGHHSKLIINPGRGLSLHIGSRVLHATYLNKKRRLIQPSRRQIDRWVQIIRGLFIRGRAGP